MILFIVSFIAGVLSVLAPCVLPLLPVVLAGSVSETSNRRRPIIIIASLSISVFIFTLLLKGSTALLTVSPSFWTYVSAAILIAFGLTLIFPEAWARLVLKIPGHNKPDSWIARGYGSKSTLGTDIIVGAALGPVFTTCSPTFFVILATVLPQSFAMGALDLAAYIVGLALVLLLVAFLGQRLIGKLDWATDPNGWFRKTLGALFIIVAVAIAFGWDKQVEAAILNSGYFDITAVEQNIHMALQGPTTLPEPGNTEPGAGSQELGGTQNTGVELQASSSQLQAPSNLPPAPAEQNEGRYIEIVDPSGFVNTPGGAPITLSQFIGKKVILIDFIDYSCINCERTFPYLENWWNKYGDQGLEVIAIHTPEFAFERDIANVEAAAKQFGLTFPIVLDNDYATWNAYGNEYWPHKYLIDIHGNVVYDKIGEGGDDQVEAEIVNLLQQRLQFLGLPGTINTGTSTMSDYTIQAESPETYFGYMRNISFGNGAPSNIYSDASFTTPDTLTPDQFYLGGTWTVQDQYIQSGSSTSTLSYVFTAAKAYVILSTADGKPAQVTVLIDGKPVAPNQAGADVKNGVIDVIGTRLYNFYSGDTAQQHRVDLIFSRPGVQAYTFTFG